MSYERSTEDTHKVDQITLEYDLAYYKELLPYITGDVLDVGCGAGMFTKEYIDKPEVKSVLGVDKYTEEMFEHRKLTVVRNTLPCAFNLYQAFDTVVSTEFVEHITREELEPLLAEIKKAMRTDAVFIGSTPNKKYPTTNPFHLYEYTLDEISEIFKKFFGAVQIRDTGKDCTVWMCQK